ncbi:MAG: sulfite exporter TauE/SafE family protein [Proteobacteria bacterium]|nr:sulfite exporter TauE/SafE family protein [Pseudomonadota bacterium]MBU1737896.1 sulfite exporter TauE/SafE family protein [Pseudomonadota bacterium]
MSDAPLYLMALLTGFLGSGHCIGMCGGIVCALALSGKGQQGGMLFHLLYNGGRLVTYGFIGLLVGWLGSLLAYSTAFDGAARLVLVASDLFLIVVGLGTAGAFARLNFMRLDFPGPVKTLTGAVKKLHALPTYASALPLGLLFGFLPCGFLYAMAITAAQTASPLSGSLVMVSFGLGTLPALFAFGSVAHLLGTRARGSMLRCAGAVVVLMGLINLARHLQLLGFLPGGVAGCFC